MITADGSKANNVAPMKKGTVKITLNTSEGKSVNTELENPLYVAYYPQDIFSVQVSTEKGTTVFFRSESPELILQLVVAQSLTLKNVVGYIITGCAVAAALL